MVVGLRLVEYQVSTFVVSIIMFDVDCFNSFFLFPQFFTSIFGCALLVLVGKIVGALDWWL